MPSANPYMFGGGSGGVVKRKFYTASMPANSTSPYTSTIDVTIDTVDVNKTGLLVSFYNNNSYFLGNNLTSATLVDSNTIRITGTARAGFSLRIEVFEFDDVKGLWWGVGSTIPINTLPITNIEKCLLWGRQTGAIGVAGMSGRTSLYPVVSNGIVSYSWANGEDGGGLNPNTYSWLIVEYN